LGCERGRFFIFGADPPAQCADVLARLSRMQDNLARLRQRAMELDGNAAIAARRRQAEAAVRQYCGTARFADPSAAAGDPRSAETDPYAQPPGAADPQFGPDADGGEPDEAAQPDGAASGAGQQPLLPGRPVCVRLCDGYFFPLASAGDLGAEGAPQMCQAQCPGAETQAFSIRDGDDISEAVGPGGESYMETPNALRYRKARVPGCSCRRRDESWGQALRGAQDMLGTRDSDIIVDAEKARRMSRPAAPARKPAAAGPGKRPDEARTSPPAAPARPADSRRAVGPDGKRDVRIIAPAQP
jgi:hypothetical protein